MLYGPQAESQRIYQAKCLWLFLDYDGTLADFAPTPDDIFPDAEIINLITRLKENPKFKVAVVSGRRLDHLRALLPIPGLLLAGTYGIEILRPDGKICHRLDYEHIRPYLDGLKPHWQNLIKDYKGFYLEDKGWSLALHARFANDLQAGQVLVQAKELATDQIDLNLFRILGGHKFLEISPIAANKGKTIQYLLDLYPAGECLPIYLGDDDKDEEAFRVIQQSGGVAIYVSQESRESHADLRIPAPPAVIKWLESILNQ